MEKIVRQESCVTPDIVLAASEFHRPVTMCAALFTCNREYMPHLATVITSLLCNNAGIINCVYVIHDDIDKDNENRLVFFVRDRFETPVVFVRVDASELKKLKASEHFTYATYLRLFMDQVLPPGLDRVLYLDTDCTVVGSLAGLIGMDFVLPEENGRGVRECYVYAADHWYEHKMQRRRKRLKLKPDARYFNAGVLLVNLKLWRSQSISRQALKLAFESKGELPAHDQDIANMLFQNAWARMHSRYNMFGEMFCGKVSECAPSEVTEALKRPAIIHFTGASKPWHYLNDHPYKHMYWHYRSMTPWRRTLPDDFSIKSMIWKHMPASVQTLVSRWQHR